jgi:hypothetical protein
MYDYAIIVWDTNQKLNGKLGNNLLFSFKSNWKEFASITNQTLHDQNHSNNNDGRFRKTACRD